MTRIPSFPEFKRLDLADRQVIESYTCHFDPYSDLNFTSLWCWDTDSEVEWSIFDGTLIVKLPSYGSDVPPRFTLIGGRDYSAKALHLMSDDGLGCQLDLVPEVVAQSLRSDDRFVVEEDRDNADYVIDIAEFLERAGKQYENLRKKHSHFRRRTPTVVPLDLDTECAQKFISDVSRSWFADHPPDTEDMAGQRESEAAAITKSLSMGLPLHGTGVLLDGEPYAFELWELVGSQWCVSHFAKTAHRLPGASCFTITETLTRASSAGARFHNEEQDLGVPGLRFAKLSHRPSKFLRKFSVRLATG